MEETKKNFENNINERFTFSKKFNLNNKKKNPSGSTKTKTETQTGQTREKIVLTEGNDMEVCKQWVSIARRMNRNLLPAFIDHVMDGYSHTYNSYVYACTACAIATAYACGKDSLSGFQASTMAIMFPLYFWYYDNKTSIKIINYDDMLYPQYEYKYEKTLDRATWEKLQTAAQNRLEETQYGMVRDDVRQHWISIVNGIVPFGYTVKEDD